MPFFMHQPGAPLHEAAAACLLQRLSLAGRIGTGFCQEPFVSTVGVYTGRHLIQEIKTRESLFWLRRTHDS